MPNDKLKPSRTRMIAYGAVVIGMFAILLGLAWPHIVPDETFWSEVDAREYNEAYEAAHTATMGHDHSHSGDHSHAKGTNDDLGAARSRLDLSEHKLERARGFQANTGKILSVAGAVVALLGVLFLRNQASS